MNVRWGGFEHGDIVEVAPAVVGHIFAFQMRYGEPWAEIRLHTTRWTQYNWYPVRKLKWRRR